MTLSGGIKVRDTVCDDLAFTDDVTELGYSTDDLSHRLQFLEFSSSKAGLHMNPAKSSTQHIGCGGDAPAVTPQDIRDLKSTHECPKAWCTRRFTSAAEVRAHIVWHDKREGGSIDQAHLACGQIVGARGPPEHRFYLVLWPDGEFKRLLHKTFTPQSQHLIDNFFFHTLSFGSWWRHRRRPK